MIVYNIANDFTFGFKGSGKTRDELEEYFQAMPKTQTHNPDLICEFESIDITPDRILGGGQKQYGKKGDTFIKNFPETKLLYDKEDNKITFSESAKKHECYYLIEYFARKKLANKGVALIHASGVNINDSSILFPAWRNTGKTNTLLSLLLKHPDNYYHSDDRVWVTNSAEVYGYPVKAHLAQFNYDSFPEINRYKGFNKCGKIISNKIDDITRGSQFLPLEATRMLNNRYLMPEADKVLIEDIIKTASYKNHSHIESLIFLQRSNCKEPQLKEISEKEAITRLINTNYYEWNSYLKELFTIHDTLFPDNQLSYELTNLLEQEKKIMKETIKKSNNRLLLMPSEEEWRQYDLSGQINNLFTENEII